MSEVLLKTVIELSPVEDEDDEEEDSRLGEGAEAKAFSYNFRSALACFCTRFLAMFNRVSQFTSFKEAHSSKSTKARSSLKIHQKISDTL